MRFTVPALCALSLVASGCDGDDGRIPTVSPKDHDRVVVGNSDEDASTASTGRDSGPPAPKPDAGSLAATSCERVEALRSSGEDTPNLTSTDAPSDFVVTRQSLSWNTDCANPVLTLELSDGTCPRGAGHQLSLTFPANAVADGQIHLGENQVSADMATAIQVRYVRPKRLKPSGTWGNCREARGQVVFLEAPDLSTRSAVLQARYQLTTDACDDATSGSMLVVGAFRIQLRVPLAEVCPDRTL